MSTYGALYPQGVPRPRKLDSANKLLTFVKGAARLVLPKVVAYSEDLIPLFM